MNDSKLSAKKIFLTLLGYQTTWLFCIIGEYYNFSFFGLIVGIIYLAAFFYYNNNKIRALKICLFFSLIGYSFDSTLGFNGIFKINSTIMIGYLPFWFIVLWPSFATLFVDILVFLKNRPVTAFFMGSLLAPPTYYTGIPLGIAKSSNLLLTLILMLFFWGLFLSFYSFCLRKNYFI